MSQITKKQSSAGMVLYHSLISGVQQLFNPSKKLLAIEKMNDMAAKGTGMQKNPKAVAIKKSARIITNRQEEEIEPVIFSINGIKFALTPVSLEEEESKRVDGYRYLSI